MAESSSIKLKTQSKRPRSRKGKEKAEDDSSSLPQNIPLPQSDDEASPHASSSKLPLIATSNQTNEVPSARKAPRKERKRNKQTLDNIDAVPAVGPSSTKPSERRRRKREKRDRDAHPHDHKDNLSARTKNPQRNKLKSEWELVPVAQNEISKIPPVWSRDGRFYISAAGNSIHIHDTTLPAFKRLSTIPAHSRPISAILIHPVNPLQLLTAGLDGSIKVWDWVEGRLLRSIERDDASSVLQMCVGQVLGRWWIFFTTEAKSSRHKGAQYLVNRIVLSSDSKSKSEPFSIGKLSATPSALIISPRTTYLVALASNKAYAYRFPTTPETQPNWKPTTVKFVSDQIFTCGAFAPDKNVAGRSEEWFATGDVYGVVRLWHGLGDAFRQLDAASSTAHGIERPNQPHMSAKDKRLPTTSLHWHAHAVAAIAFTASGAQLLSVGEESVLVQWHLASGKREYIPRLGGRPIITLAVKSALRGVEEEWWMSFADGSVVKVGAASGQIATVGQNVKLDPLRPSKTGPYPLSVHPSTRSLVVPSSHPSTLQFIDTTNSSVLFDLEVAPSNRITRRDDKELIPVAVEHVAFSGIQGGVSWWMASSESREGEEIEGGGNVRNLKIWKWDHQRYVTNTQLPRPHGASEITNLLFSPVRAGSGPDASSAPYLLTCDNEGVAKLWYVRKAKKSEEGKVSAKKAPAYDLFWSTRSTFSYRSMPIRDAVFSPDGTTLVLAHGSLVTLWDVESNALLKVLDSSPLTAIKKLVFVGHEGRYLAAAGEKSGLVIWDLLSCEVLWSLPDKVVDLIVAHQYDATFVITYRKGGSCALETFSAITNKPIKMVTIAQPLRALTILPEAPSKNPSPIFHFIGVADSGEIYRFGDTASIIRQTTNKISTSIDKKSTSIWQEMFGKEAFLDDINPEISEEQQKQATSALQAQANKSGRPADVFEGPSHTLPPVGLLFDAFMEEMLKSTRVASRTIKDESSNKVEILYETKDDAPPSPHVNISRSNAKGKHVTDAEISELEVFFKDILGKKTSDSEPTTMSQDTSIANGLLPTDSKQIRNGNDGSRSDASDASDIEGGPITSAKLLNGKSKANGLSQSTPGGSSMAKFQGQSLRKTSSSSKLNGSHKIEVDESDDDDERDIDNIASTPKGTEGSAKKRGKKRRAPRAGA